MSENQYRFVYEGGIGEIEEKKSRFIAAVQPVSSEEEALAFLAARKKEFWDARHNCHAFVIGKNSELQRCSDDGEPSGTAGRPMLEILLREGLHDTAVVVTRYFGGTLLGTGGLVRAYQGAVQAGLSNCRIAEKQIGREFTVRTDYTDLAKVQRLMAEEELPAVDTLYEDAVTLRFMTPEEKRESILAALTDATAGRATVTIGDPEEFAVVDREILRFRTNSA